MTAHVSSKLPIPMPHTTDVDAKAKGRGRVSTPGNPYIIGLPREAGAKFGEFLKDGGEKVGQGIQEIVRGIGPLDPKQAGTGGAWKRPDVVVKPRSHSTNPGHGHSPIPLGRHA
ncbi:MAG: hypothetical protein H7287_12135, partial [Thermoleophilia bacterium]|nr:hypothetical protein [Thermoleophilia bacterium]